MLPDFIKEPDHVYHDKAGEYLSSHLLKLFSKCPLEYKRKIDSDEDSVDTAVFAFGRAAHVLILEGEQRYLEVASIPPNNPKTGAPYGNKTKAYQEWVRGLSDDEIPVSVVDHDKLCSMKDSVDNHPVCGKWFSNPGTAEGVVRYNYHGIPCQIRVDYFLEDIGIVDLKTTYDIDEFTAQVEEYQYMMQIAFYWDIIKEVTGKDYDCYFVVVEKREPYRCGVWKPVPTRLANEARDNIKLIDKLIGCQRINSWPTGYEGVKTIW